MKCFQSHAAKMRVRLARSKGKADQRCHAIVLRSGLKKSLGCGKEENEDPVLPSRVVKGADKRENDTCFFYFSLCQKSVMLILELVRLRRFYRRVLLLYLTKRMARRNNIVKSYSEIKIYG